LQVKRERSRRRYCIGGGFLWSRNGMNHTWYVAYEVPADGALLRRRHPRLKRAAKLIQINNQALDVK
jgi:hypothetical protein